MTNMQARQLKYNFELHKRGLVPKEFETSLTKKVNGLLESTGLDRREPFIKEIIRNVKTEVYGTRKKTNVPRPSVNSFGDHAFNDMSLLGAPSYKQQGQRRRRGQSRKEMYHTKQNRKSCSPAHCNQNVSFSVIEVFQLDMIKTATFSAVITC